MYQNVSRQNELSTELYEAKNLVFNLLNQRRGNSHLNIFWQYFIISISVVLNNFIKNRFIMKSNDRMCEAFGGQASRPYNKTDTHLLFIYSLIHINNKKSSTFVSKFK